MPMIAIGDAAGSVPCRIVFKSIPYSASVTGAMLTRHSLIVTGKHALSSNAHSNPVFFVPVVLVVFVVFVFVFVVFAFFVILTF
ncbi:MAG: hypothetical protein ACE5EC_03645 [Phycisphaerae bacterium]